MTPKSSCRFPYGLCEHCGRRRSAGEKCAMGAVEPSGTKYKQTMFEVMNQINQINDIVFPLFRLALQSNSF